MSWLEDKMKKWAWHVDRHATPGQGSKVIEGYDRIPDNPADYATWSEQAMERLAAVIPDQTIREAVMQARSCVFTEEFGDDAILALAALFAETRNIDTVLEAMCSNREKFGRPYREGSVIYEIREPRDPAAFAKAATSYEKQLAACYCPLIRATRRVVSKEYCHCSAGWYKGIYEGIFKAPARVEVIQSLISGDDRCQFAICLPDVLK